MLEKYNFCKEYIEYTFGKCKWGKFPRIEGLKVWTSRVNYKGSDMLDISVKCGKSAFSPTWNMVMGIKNRTLPVTMYVERYCKLVKATLFSENSEWNKIRNMGEVTLCCYCGKDKFCHRFILAMIMVAMGAEYMGER